MKGIQLEGTDKQILIVEAGERVFSLADTQSAIILGDGENSEEVKVTSVFPNKLEELDAVPFSATLAACVRVFLDDPDWVHQARERITKMEQEKQA